MDKDRIKIKINDYEIRYERREENQEWLVFGRDEDVYTLLSNFDICMDLAVRLQNFLDGTEPVNS